MALTEIGDIFMKSQIFEWSISNFFCYTEESAAYFSPDFLIGDSEWYISIYPNGETRDSKRFVSIFLQKCDEGDVKTVEFEIGIKTLNNTIDHKRAKCHTFCTKSVSWGWKKFIKRSELLQRKSELVPLGILTITCFVRIKDAVPDLKTRHCKLAKNLKALFDSKQITDVTLHVKDHSFEAHRSILAARSPVFAAMFRNETLENLTGTVRIPDVDPEAFKVFLIFLYSGEIQFSNFNFCELYKISHKYDVPDLKLLCVNFMVENLSVENFCETLMFSYKFEEKELLTRIQNFFSKNFEKIVSSDSWIIFLENNVCLGNELLKAMAPNVKIID